MKQTYTLFCLYTQKMHIVLLHVCSKIWKVLLKYINIISCSFVFLSNQKIYNHKNRGERERERDYICTCIPLL